jgi:cobalamin biosynthetic protein CobC
MTAGDVDMASGAVEHGGSLSRAERLYPGAPKPWLDLSTGINPHSYPLFELPASVFARLPDESRADELVSLATTAYGAPSTRCVAAAPGTQVLLPPVMGLARRGRAAVLSPTYAEHARAAAIVGHAVAEVRDFDALFDADLAIVVNPNNPDGHICARDDLLRLAAHLRGKGGLLVVDEAFMDVGPRAQSLAPDVEAGGIVVLRSFGKFFGLAGIRLGFALAAPELAEHLRNRLGPWAVSGPTLEIGIRALADLDWQDAMRERLRTDAARLDALLDRHGLAVAGGTDLYRFVRVPGARALAVALGRQGVLVRSFDFDEQALRFGLPGDEVEFRRLADALPTAAEQAEHG